MKKNRIILFLFAAVSLFANAQSPEHWTAIDNNHIAWQPGSYVYSENLGKLVYTGNFERESGEKYIPVFDGNEWSVFIDSVGSGINTLVDYEGGVLVGGGIILIENQQMPYIAFFDGDTWSFPWEFNGLIEKLVWLNDTLYATGAFTEIDGEPAYNVARLVGNEWEGVYSLGPGVSFTLFNDMAYFQGEYYIGGNFEQDGGPNDFAILRNGNLEHIGDETVSIGTVEDLQVYNDELYVGGAINYSDNSPYHLIFRWDGEDYNTVGPYMHYAEGAIVGGRVQFMKVKDGYLYTGGGFKYIGDEQIAYVARWNGTVWCGLYGEEHLQPELDFDQFFSGMEFFEDQLVILKAFVYEDGSYDGHWMYTGGDEVSICTAPLSVNNSFTPQIAFGLYPNPAQTQITIQCDEQIVRVEVMDVSGRVLQSSGLLTDNGILDISAYPAGIYLVRIETNDGFGVRKMVVE